jgi:Spy/CpxP family protein refolding chaperone
MPRLCSATFVVLMFLCGILIGGLSDHWWMARNARRADWPDSRAHVLEQIDQELSLTPDQSKQLEGILDGAMKDFDDLHNRAHQVRLDTRDRIRAILTEPQKQKFEATMARLQRTMGASQ